MLPCRVAWSEQESLCLKRDALIACLEAAKQLHSKQWAQTSVEIAYEVNLAPINLIVPERKHPVDYASSCPSISSGGRLEGQRSWKVTVYICECDPFKIVCLTASLNYRKP